MSFDVKFFKFFHFHTPLTLFLHTPPLIRYLFTIPLYYPLTYPPYHPGQELHERPVLRENIHLEYFLDFCSTVTTKYICLLCRWEFIKTKLFKQEWERALLFCWYLSLVKAVKNIITITYRTKLLPLGLKIKKNNLNSDITYSKSE